ncbi:hypothetical protein [Ruania alba]|uniref:Uncharacterized protein n=1 Tax=Ruania alba TaxID=648782 RepID=A0A1H5G9A7_9MICO|nr:hypothetical protein [Ruania alba]SEE12287.1 hypothetical protein SAMN04488554_1580 [Ruania alba]
MRLVTLLEQIELINRDDLDAAMEFGPLELGPRGITVHELLCVDGRSRVATSPQVAEFYAYALWWKHCSVELEWCDPQHSAELVAQPPVRQMITADIAHQDLQIPGLAPSTAVLFALDNRESPFERAYFVFDISEPRVVHAGSEISVFDDLTGYLESWRRSLA